MKEAFVELWDILWACMIVPLIAIGIVVAGISSSDIRDATEVERCETVSIYCQTQEK